MIGNPTETRQDEMTIKLIRKIKPTNVAVSRTVPTPGSKLYDIAQERGIFNVKDYTEFDYYSNTKSKYPLKLEHLTCEDLYFYEKRINKLAQKIRTKSLLLSPSSYIQAVKDPIKAICFIRGLFRGK
jgi:hypothetical protein